MRAYSTDAIKPAVTGGTVRTHRYQITISGGLGELGREAFADFKIEYADGSTLLTGDLDQAALYSALNRILALGLELVALSRLNGARVWPGAAGFPVIPEG
jgi:hypothetical protein